MTTHNGRTQLKGNARTATAEKAAGLYYAGSTIRSVAGQIGRSYGCTRQLLLEAKVTLRARGGGIRKAGA